MQAQSTTFNRRQFLQIAGIGAAGAALAACAVPSAAPSAAPAAEGGAVTLTFLTGEDPRAPIGEQPLFTEWQKATGITIEWQPAPSSSLGEKVNLMLSADEAPDIFIGPRNTIKQFGAEACLPLDDLIAEHAPNYTALLEEYATAAKDLRAADGKMYAMAGRNNNVYMGWMYRKDLADKLNITQMATLDDWYNYMVAVKKDDANTHGVGIYGDVLGVVYSLKGAFGIKGTMNDWMTQVDGQWVNASILPGAKAAVATVAKWYQEGLIDPNMLSTVEWEQGKEKWMNGTSVVGVNDYLAVDSYELQYREQHPDSKFDIVAVAPPTGPDGGQTELYNFTGFAGFGYALGKNCKDPVAAVKFLDFIFSEEGLLLYSLGVEGVTFSKDGDKYEFLPEVKDLVNQTVKEGGMEMGVALWKLYGIGFPFFSSKAFPAPAPYNSAHIGFTVSEEMAAAQAMGAQYQEVKIPAPVFTQEEQDELTQINADMDTYQAETWVGMIKGDVSMDTWDAYVEQMKALNVERVVELWNTAAARG
ncbi:MAG: extracellular solute-binding protein [Caldilinea sp. CFX5]|nr:extracellular solute-binding protein [Caldilinea sp. CFX5]